MKFQKSLNSYLKNAKKNEIKKPRVNFNDLKVSNDITGDDIYEGQKEKIRDKKAKKKEQKKEAKEQVMKDVQSMD